MGLTSIAIGFLARSGFKFDLPITQGVHYLSRKEEQEARTTITKHDEKQNEIEDMVLKPEDDALVNHIRSAVQQWQSQPVEHQEDYLNIPGEVEGVPSVLSKYQMRLTHQVVRKEYPKLKTAGMKHFIQVTNPNEEQQESEKLHKAQQRERRIADAVGFRWLMEAIFGGNITEMPDSYVGHGLPDDLNGLTPDEFLDQLQDKLRKKRRILVGHNCFTDLVNLYKCFIGDLPPDVEEFSSVICELLPGVVDTKNLASLGSARWGDTSLEGVERSITSELLPQIDIPAEYDRYQYASSYHEAGYDSLLTARVAIKLSAKLEREGKYLEKQKETEQASNSTRTNFGADENFDVSLEEPAESQTGQQTVSLLEPVKMLAAPLTAVKAWLGKPTTVFEGRPKKEASVEAALASSDTSSASVVAVKVKDQPLSQSKKEVTKIKNSLPKTNIYESLDMDQSGPEQESEDESLVKEADSAAKAKSIEEMVKAGGSMPRWDSATGFWRFFGNKLQVNGSQEGTCHLIMRSDLEKAD